MKNTVCLRSDLDLSKSEIVKITGAQYRAVELWLQGESVPRVNYLVMLAKHLNCNIAYLLNQTNVKDADSSYEFSKDKLYLYHVYDPKKMSQKALAEKIGIPEPTLNKLLSNRMGNIKTYLKCAAYLDVSIDYFLGLTDKKNWRNDGYRRPCFYRIYNQTHSLLYHAISDISGTVHTTRGEILLEKEFDLLMEKEKTCYEKEIL